MLINYSNQDMIKDIYLHDSIFYGFVYDYRNRKIDFTCENSFFKTKHHLTFQNVILANMQSCSFWHSGRNIYGMAIESHPPLLNDLLALQEQHKDLYQGSYLDRGISYIAVNIIINSGDTLQIICENINCDKESIL